MLFKKVFRVTGALFSEEKSNGNFVRENVKK